MTSLLATDVDTFVAWTAAWEGPQAARTLELTR